jgi:hypothetical protein
MIHAYRKAMDALYLACVVLAGTRGGDFGGVPWAVYTARHQPGGVVARADRGAVTIVLTFGAAAYTAVASMNVSFSSPCCRRARRT